MTVYPVLVLHSFTIIIIVIIIIISLIIIIVINDLSHLHRYTETCVQ